MAQAPVTHQQPMKKILIIDDEQSIRKVLEIHLQDAGYEVVTAENGKRGLELAMKSNVDLVLCDLKLPDRPGLEVIKTLRTIRGLVPVVVISGFIDDTTISDAREAGVKEYLSKPFLKEKLLSLLNTIFCDRKESGDHESISA